MKRTYKKLVSKQIIQAELACIFISFSIFLVCCGKAQSSDTGFVAKHGQLSVKGTQLIDKNGDVLQLKGVSLGWHNWWSRYYSVPTVTWLNSDWKANLLRVAIGVEPEGAYLTDKKLAVDCLNTAVGAAIRNDMYVIVDWHAHHIHLDTAKSFFAEVATEYGNTPNIIYEIFNEPWGNDYTWDEVKKYSEEVIATIRAIDSDNIILVGCPNWDQDIHLAADSPIEGFNNIMYTMHFYAATHEKSLRERTDYALNKGLPVFISECASMEASGDGAIDTAEWRIYTEWMDSRKLSYVMWSISSKSETCSMLRSDDTPSAAQVPLTNWKDSDLKEWGIMVRKIICDR
ncbi:MAG: glycoside hydrolase family 5 protein [Bacteroidales bacterium]|jgi:endoglucanase|nr:glycoside hydrolase family 5 protein [Bacteroidales bacterium]